MQNVTHINAGKSLRMKAASDSTYQRAANASAIANAIEFCDDSQALELLDMIHPVDRVHVYRKLNA